MAKDQELREQHLCFYSEDVAVIDQELDGFLELSGASCAMLIDRSGHMVTRRGASMDGSLESVAALAAGSFSATREMARIIGEGEFIDLDRVSGTFFETGGGVDFLVEDLGVGLVGDEGHGEPLEKDE